MYVPVIDPNQAGVAQHDGFGAILFDRAQSLFQRLVDHQFGVVQVVRAAIELAHRGQRAIHAIGAGMAALHGQCALRQGEDGKPPAQAQGGEHRRHKTASHGYIDHLAGGLDATHVKVCHPQAIVAFLGQLARQPHHCHAVFLPVGAVFHARAAFADMPDIDQHIRRRHGPQRLQQRRGIGA